MCADSGCVGNNLTLLPQILTLDPRAGPRSVTIRGGSHPHEHVKLPSLSFRRSYCSYGLFCSCQDLCDAPYGVEVGVRISRRPEKLFWSGVLFWLIFRIFSLFCRLRVSYRLLIAFSRFWKGFGRVLASKITHKSSFAA